MKKSDLKKIEEGSYIYDGINGYEVTKIYKSGIQYLYEWKNYYGRFWEYNFVTYEELLKDYWKLIE